MAAMKQSLKTLRFCRGWLLLFPLLLLWGCGTKPSPAPSPINEQMQEALSPTPVASSSDDIPLSEDSEETIVNGVFSFFNEAGTTMESRILTPKGYVRIPSVSGELTGYLRNLPLKESGSEVMLYNGQAKGNQTDHAAVFDLELGDQDLQQCADSIIRIYAEYYWSIGAYEKIAFHLTNGFYMEYTKWRAGNRLKVEGNRVEWQKTADYNDSYDAFQQYLKNVFIYAGTLSLSQECKKITADELKPGDMFLYGGSPGHCVLIVDLAQNINGERCFLLAQGYMPAQDFHILKNPLHPEDPWYYASELSYPLKTPAWTFQEGSLVRWSNFILNEANKPLVFEEASSSGLKNSSIPAMSSDVIQAVDQASSQVTLLAAGDNLIHMEVVKSGLQEDGTYQYDHLYSNLKDEISAADIAVINQETILGGSEFPYSGYPDFNSPTEIGDAIIGAGFDVVLHATNHTMDMGVEGIKNTFSYWKQHPEIKVLGINQTEEQRKEIPILEKNGIKFAMLNYTFSLNNHSLPEDQPYLVNLLDRDQMQEDILKAEKFADFTIVFPHWGAEYVYEPISMQKELTDFFYKLGVDLVIGTHPHVLQPVEWIQKEKGHKMLVYYSIGNFMSYQKEAPRMLGGLARVTIKKGLNGTYISSAEITPIITHYENGPADFHYGIYPLADYTSELADQHGVSDLARDGALTYDATVALAKQILGTWYSD